MKITVYGQGHTIPSTRFRVQSLVQKMKDKGIFWDVRNAYSSSYPPKGGIVVRLCWLVRELLFRLPQIISSYRSDVVIFQREMISTLPTLERFSGRPRILDVDDAIWMYRSGRAAKSIAKSADYIVCGNHFLASYFSQFGKPVSVIPTAVDVDRFRPASDPVDSKVIGWSGTSGGFRFLYGIESVLVKILEAYPEWNLRIVSDSLPQFKQIPESRVEFIQWSAETEVESIQGMTIGIMPLDDSEWSKGKCSYKMLLYMACGIPVVVSNFGMNGEILEHAFIGFGADCEAQWCEHLGKLINDKELRIRAGRNARKVVRENYSLDVIVSKWLAVFRNFQK